MSKIDLMIQQIQNFTPPSGTMTHILLDSWYSAKKSGKLHVIEDFTLQQASDAIVRCAFPLIPTNRKRGCQGGKKLG